jgi:hypothetical protein
MRVLDLPTPSGKKKDFASAERILMLGAGALSDNRAP